MSEVVAADWRPTAPLATLRLRAALLQRTRRYFAETGALEIETPTLVRAAVTDVHLESLEVRAGDGSPVGFLHTSPEYAMKRLLCAGAPDVYQVARVFREGERGRYHNPEFTMLEWYRLGIDHHALMQDVEALLRALLEPHRTVGPTQHVTYSDAFEASLGIDPLAAGAHEIAVALRRAGADLPESLVDDHDGLLDFAIATVVAPACAISRPRRLRSRACAGRWHRASRRSGARSSWPMDFTSSGMRRSSRGASRPISPRGVAAGNRNPRRTPASSPRLQPACHPVRAWLWVSTVS